MSNDVAGQFVYLAGSFRGLRRPQVEERLIALGAQLLHQLTPAVTLVVAGRQAGIAQARARQLGIPVRTEGWLLSLFADNPAPPPPAPLAQPPADRPLLGRRIAVAGTFSLLRKHDAIAQLRARGARISPTVTRKTDLVIAGVRAGAKAARARTLGIPVKDEAWLTAILAGRTPSEADDRSADALPVTRGPLADYLARFDAMVQELQSHPDVQILVYWRGEPMRDSALRRVEGSWRASFEDSIRNLYRQANGLALFWMSRRDPAFVGRRFGFKATQPSVGDLDLYDHIASMRAIWLPPLERAMDRAGALVPFSPARPRSQEVVAYGRRFSGDGLENAIRIFDFAGRGLAGGFLTQAGEGAPPVLVGEGRPLRWTASRVTDFADYMEFVLAHYGDREGRIANYRLSRHETRSVPPEQGGAGWWQRHPVGLDRLLRHRGTSGSPGGSGRRSGGLVDAGGGRLDRDRRRPDGAESGRTRRDDGGSGASTGRRSGGGGDRRRRLDEWTRAGRVPSSSIRDLIDWLDDPSDEILRDVVTLLAQAGVAAVAAAPRLLDLLRRGRLDPRPVGQALQNMGQLDVNLVVDLVEGARLTQGQDRWQEYGTWSRVLAQTGKKGVPALVQQLDHRDSGVRRAVMKALWHLGPTARRAVPRLERFLRDDPSYLREVERSGRLSPRTRARLEQDESVFAGLAIARLDDRKTGSVLDQLRQATYIERDDIAVRGAVHALAGGSAELAIRAIKELINLTGYAGVEERRSAKDTIARLGDRVVPDLLDTFERDSGWSWDLDTIRAQAAALLGGFSLSASQKDRAGRATEDLLRRNPDPGGLGDQARGALRKFKS